MVLFVFVKTTDSQCTMTAAISTLYKYYITCFNSHNMTETNEIITG